MTPRRDPRSDPFAAERLHRVPACREQLLVVMPSHPHRVCR
ncbi:hypothetical protein BN1723_020857, partial [Verticillium longisporum]